MLTSSDKKNGLLFNLYQKILDNANSPKALWIYCLVSFAESSFFPLPPDLLMIPMLVSNKKLAWRLAFLGTIFSVLGGLLGYAIGYYLFNSVGKLLIETYNMQAGFEKFHSGYTEWGFWIIALKGLTPVPYKLVTIASGVAQYPILPFIGASILARSFRFYLLAALLWKYGYVAKKIMDRYLGWCLLGSLVIIILGFLIFKFLGA